MSEVEMPVGPMSRSFADASKRTGIIYMPLSRDLAFCECLGKKAVQVWDVEGKHRRAPRRCAPCLELCGVSVQWARAMLLL